MNEDQSLWKSTDVKDEVRSSGSSRWMKVRAEEGEGTEVNEDQSFWKTTDV